MSVLNQLPTIYRLAVLQGARVEAYIKNEKAWVPILKYHAITSRTPYRINEKDLNIFEKVKSSIPEFFETIKFDEYDYLVPKNALVPGQYIIMEYGLGVVVQVQEDLTLKAFEFEEGKALLDSTNEKPYYSQSHESFYGVDEEHAFKE